MFGYEINNENLKIVVDDISTQLKDMIKIKYVYYTIATIAFIAVIAILLLIPSNIVKIEPLNSYDIDNIDEIIINNEYIFVGKVINSTYEYKFDENYALPYNTYVVEVEEVIKGDLEKSQNIEIEKTGGYYKSIFYQYEKTGKIENDNDLLDIDKYYIFAGNKRDDYSSLSLDEVRGARPLYDNPVSSVVYEYFIAVKNAKPHKESDEE